MFPDVESGTVVSDGGKSDYSKSDKLKPTPSGTPLPSPVLTAGSGASRASRNFAKWFRASVPLSPLSPTSPRSGFGVGDSLEESGLVYVEDGLRHDKDLGLVEMSKPKDKGKRESGNDIRIEHTISVESGRESDDDIEAVGHAVWSGLQTMSFFSVW
jgi:hypothetical protein